MAGREVSWQVQQHLVSLLSTQPLLQVRAGDSALSLLPPWHIYERAVGYHLLHVGTRIVYTSIKKFRDDLTTHPPDHFVCVPLVLDSLYNKVGGRVLQ